MTVSTLQSGPPGSGGTGEGRAPKQPLWRLSPTRVPWALLPLGRRGGDQLPRLPGTGRFLRTLDFQGEVGVPGATGLVVSLRGPLRCPVSSGGSPFLSTVGWGHLPCAFLCAGVMGPSCPLQVLGAPSPRGRQPSADGLWTLCSSLSVTTSSSGPRCSGICEGCWGDSEPLGDTRQV